MGRLSRLVTRRPPRPAAPRPDRSPLVGTAAPDVDGVAPDGTARRVAVAEGAVVFLTSSCLACREVWAALAAGPPAGLTAVVTPDPTLEDARAVAALAPPGVPVVMSTAAWQAWRAGASPWVARVAGGVVTAEGPAAGWSDVARVAGA